MSEHHDLRHEIARETIAQKMQTLRSETNAIAVMISELERSKQEDKAGDAIYQLQLRVDALLKVPLAHGESAKFAAAKAQSFLQLAHVSSEVYKPDQTAPATAWIARLDAEIEHARRRAQHAMQFSDALHQWKGTEDKASGELVIDEPMSFAPEPAGFDVSAFLASNGVSSEVIRALQSGASETSDFGESTLKDRISTGEVQEAMIKLAKDAKSHDVETRRQLKDESSREIVLRELSETFTALWCTIETWKWPEEGITQLQRTHLNGKRRDTLSLNVVQAVFLQVVATRWARHFGEALNSTRQKVSEIAPFTEVSGFCDENETDENELRCMLGLVAYANNEDMADMTEKGGTEQLRRLNTALNGLGSMVSDPEHGQLERRWLENRGGLATSLGASHFFSPPARSGSADPYSELGEEVPAMNENSWTAGVFAQRPALLFSEIYRLITLDIQLLRATSDTESPTESVATFMHADLRDFGASVPHSVTLSVLEFFGLPPQWLAWFRTFLRIPLVPRSGSTPTMSERGTPFGLHISSLTNELLLLLLDLALHASARVTVRRNHDDVWIWSLGVDRISKAWMVMQEFSTQTGLIWNEEKTGCTVVSLDDRSGYSPKPDNLPINPLRWGVLYLAESGKWKVDQTAVALHAEAAVRELGPAQNSSSFLGKVSIYNRYAAFLARNTGVPMGFAGDQFPETYRTVLQEFERVAFGGRGLFAWLRDELHAAFPAYDTRLQEAVLYWPMRLGGFEVHPHTAMMLLHEQRVQVHRKRKIGHVQKDCFAALVDEHRERYRVISDYYTSTSVQERAANLVKDQNIRDRKLHQIQRWLLKNGNRPPSFMSFRTLLRRAITSDNGFFDRYSILFETENIEPDALEGLMLDAYESPLVDTFGPLRERRELVASALVPQYAVQDIQALTKQLYNSS